MKFSANKFRTLIDKHLKSSKIKKQVLIKQSGVPHDSFYRIYFGRTLNPNPANLDKLAKILKIKTSLFYDD